MVEHTFSHCFMVSISGGMGRFVSVVIVGRGDAVTALDLYGQLHYIVLHVSYVKMIVNTCVSYVISWPVYDSGPRRGWSCFISDFASNIFCYMNCHTIKYNLMLICAYFMSSVKSSMHSCTSIRLIAITVPPTAI
jgi:hypothetical protein